MNRPLAMTTATLLIAASCSSKKSVAVAVRTDSTFATVTTARTATATAVATLHALVAELDSVEFVIEPNARGEVESQASGFSFGTQPTPEPRIRLRAKRMKLAGQRNTETVSATQTLTTDSTGRHGLSVNDRKEASDKAAGYQPPSLVWLFGLAMLMAAVTPAIKWLLKK